MSNDIDDKKVMTEDVTFYEPTLEREFTLPHEIDKAIALLEPYQKEFADAYDKLNVESTVAALSDCMASWVALKIYFNLLRDAFDPTIRLMAYDMYSQLSAMDDVPQHVKDACKEAMEQFEDASDLEEQLDLLEPVGPSKEMLH